MSELESAHTNREEANTEQITGMAIAVTANTKSCSVIYVHKWIQ